MKILSNLLSIFVCCFILNFATADAYAAQLETSKSSIEQVIEQPKITAELEKIKKSLKKTNHYKRKN